MNRGVCWIGITTLKRKEKSRGDRSNGVFAAKHINLNLYITEFKTSDLQNLLLTSWTWFLFFVFFIFFWPFLSFIETTTGDRQETEWERGGVTQRAPGWDLSPCLPQRGQSLCTWDTCCTSWVKWHHWQLEYVYTQSDAVCLVVGWGLLVSRLGKAERLIDWNPPWGSVCNR